jgi:hypothetical protein
MERIDTELLVIARTIESFPNSIGILISDLDKGTKLGDLFKQMDEIQNEIQRIKDKILTFPRDHAKRFLAALGTLSEAICSLQFIREGDVEFIGSPGDEGFVDIREDCIDILGRWIVNHAASFESLGSELQVEWELNQGSDHKLSDILYPERKTDSFEFKNGRVSYNGKDLMFPAVGEAVEVFEKLVNANGQIVAFEKLDPGCSGTASECLKSLISRIRKHIKTTPFTIPPAQKGGGYQLISRTP